LNRGTALKKKIQNKSIDGSKLKKKKEKKKNRGIIIKKYRNQF
jgi:hypothetical protein